MTYYGLDVRFVPITEWHGPQTLNRKKSNFGTTLGKTIELLNRELRYLGAKNILIQMDCDESQIRNDGYPRSSCVAGPRVIVSFDSKHGPLSYPCDTFKNWDCNIRAIALALEALRTVDRYGVTKRGEQYTGFKRLGNGAAPAAMTIEQAATFIASVPGSHLASDILRERDLYRVSYRWAATKLHPDAGGDTAKFQRLQDAKRVLDLHHGLAK